MISKIILENKRILVFWGIIVIGLPFSTTLAYYLAFNQRVYPQVSVCGIPLTGKTKKETLLVVENLIKEAPLKITLTSGVQNYPVDLSSFKYEPQNTVSDIFKLGREKAFFFNLKQIYSLYINTNDSSVVFSLDESGLDETIASVSALLFQPAVNPEIKVINKNGEKNILVEPGKNGQNVDKRRLKTDIFHQISCPKKEIKLEIPLIINTPKISQEMVNLTRDRALSFLNKEILLHLDDQNWQINDDEIISFLSFDGSFDRNKIAQYTKNFTQTINLLPENATFQFENNIVTVFKPSREGISLQETQFTDELTNKLQQLEKNGQKQEMAIPAVKTPAKISTSDANSLGIKELIGKGTSLFYGSISERIHNLQLASLKLNGILIGPDEVFSFNQALGDVSADTGFKQAYIIKEGRTVLGDGGGVCQVSTTLFRAALNSGLPIIERHAHAYRVHYYEDDLGPGFDATVFDPSADLKFKNDTGDFILIQTDIDLKKKQLTFDLYGTKDGRQVEISKARVWDKQPPPPDLYQDDPTLPAGTIKQIDWKAWGSKTAFDYKVSKDSEIIFEKTFTSIYRPWQAVYLRGAGG